MQMVRKIKKVQVKPKATIQQKDQPALTSLDTENQLNVRWWKENESSQDAKSIKKALALALVVANGYSRQ